MNQPIKHRYFSNYRPTLSKGIIRSSGQWHLINSHLLTVSDVRKNMCFGCGKAYLYDKNDKSYLITRVNTLDEVKAIIETIRKVNAE